METAIYAAIYFNDLNYIEKVLKSILINGNFKSIEQGTVLLYEDKQTEISIEPHADSFYLSGRIKDNISNSQEIINEIASVLKDAGVQFSIDYQEENENGVTTSLEFNISNKTDLN